MGFRARPAADFGRDIKDWKAGTTLEMGPETAGFVADVGGPAGKVRGTLGDLPAGKYRVQAALIVNHDRDWRECAGNLYSKVATMEVGRGKG